jgi:hypothetical protein
MIDVGAACKVTERGENYCSAFTDEYIDPIAKGKRLCYDPYNAITH